MSPKGASAPHLAVRQMILINVPAHMGPQRAVLRTREVGAYDLCQVYEVVPNRVIDVEVDLLVSFDFVDGLRSISIIYRPTN